MPEWNQCWYCGVTLTKRGTRKDTSSTDDHFEPKNFGGVSKFVTACFACNQLKSNMTVDQFRDAFGVNQFHGERMKWETW